MPENTLFCYFSSAQDSELSDLQSPVWRAADKALIDRYWDGRLPFREKGADWKNLTEVAALWSGAHVYFLFRCWFDRLIINPDWETAAPVRGLWEKDVVEAFLRPESCDDYFEIEASPLGQWLDVHIIKPRIDVDYRWESGLELRAGVDHEARIWSVIVRLPFAPMMSLYTERQAPKVGDAWRLNLYRMAGEHPNREYLAWRPTFTAQPDFHVPSAFGSLIFLSSDGSRSGVTEDH
jgi:alpha-galactosidase